MGPGPPSLRTGPPFPLVTPARRPASVGDHRLTVGHQADGADEAVLLTGRGAEHGGPGDPEAVDEGGRDLHLDDVAAGAEQRADVDDRAQPVDGGAPLCR